MAIDRRIANVRSHLPTPSTAETVSAARPGHSERQVDDAPLQACGRKIEAK